MTFENPEVESFLFQLYTITDGDTEANVSMYDVGEVLGLGKGDTGKLAEALYSEGYAELKTLSGGIGITMMGLKALNVSMDSADSESLSLGTDHVLTDQGRDTAEIILQEIKAVISDTKLTYAHLEELVIDIKTIEIQMLSPRPKTEVIREVLKSIHQVLDTSGPEQLNSRLNSLITS